jgi:cell division protein FtsB
LVQRRFLTVAAVALVVWVGYVFVFSDYGLRNLLVLRGREAALEQRIAALAEKRARLAQEKIALGGDSETIERVAREKYFLARPGERTYIFVPVDSTGTPRPSLGPSIEPDAREER